MFVMNSLIYDARNKVCQAAIQGEYDYVLWLDSDMIFPSNTLEHLFAVMQETGADMITALAFRRRPPYTPCIFKKLEPLDNGLVDFEGYNDYPDQKLFEIAGCGMACALLKTDVLFDIAGADGNVWFNPMQGAGEDTAFCIRARNHGAKIYCDSRLKIGHIGLAPVTEETFRKYNGVEK